VKGQRLQLAQDEFNHLHSALSNIAAVSTASREFFFFFFFMDRRRWSRGVVRPW
jgi:hypothetical protein